jgi:tetratricopeptide (TPR) repeat protein
MIAAQGANTNAIIASQDNLREGIDNLAYRIEDGMEGLKAAFEFGISEVVWQIEQNRQVLKNILEVLMALLDTQAKELRSRAEDAYANGWFEDALEDFIESEKKNKYDFSVHISIGMINLFQKVDREKALEYFEKAVKYARPKSPYHASFALLHVALLKRDLNQIAEAEKLTAEAIELTPEFAEALYQNAQYNAQINQVQKSLSNLEKAIRIDRNYSLKANNDNMFDPIRKEVNQLFEKLRDEVSNLTLRAYQPFRKAVKDINDFILTNKAKLDLSGLQQNNFTTEITAIDNLLKRNSYFDSMAAFAKAEDFIRKAKAYITLTEENLNNYFKKVLSSVDSDVSRAQQNENTRIQESRSRVASTFPILIVWASLIFSFFLVMKSNPNLGNRSGFANFFMLTIANVVIWGGWFISKRLLIALAGILYPETNFSHSVAGKEKEQGKNEIMNHQNNVRAFFADIKRALPS